MIDNIGKATDLLVGSPGQAFTSGFLDKGFQTEGEGIFPTLYGDHVRKKREEGRKAEDERLEKMVNHFEKLKDTDTAHHAVKRDMLLNGAYYDDADRFTKLSPHAQVGYAQQKLGLYKESYPDKLKQWMLKNSHKYSIYGQTVTPEELNNSNLYPPLLKEAMLNEAEADMTILFTLNILSTLPSNTKYPSLSKWARSLVITQPLSKISLDVSGSI